MTGRRSVLTLLAVAALAAGAFITTGSASAASRCSGSFQVLHDDHIGAMSLPAGPYAITVNGISCATASSLFADFLQDYDGHLPSPWVANASKRSFTRAGTSTGFSVKPGDYPPTPPSPPTPGSPYTCPSTFSVLHNDAIGSVKFPQGAYRTTITSRGLNCGQTSTLFAEFLDDVDGHLAGGWSVASLSGGRKGGVFTNANGQSFQQQYTGSSTGGGGVSPSDSTYCGTFSVLHNDHIGSLYVPKGTYYVYSLAPDLLSCSQSTQQFTRFLDAASMPKPWVVDAATGTFTKGPGSPTGFRIKPAKTQVLR